MTQRHTDIAGIGEVGLIERIKKIVDIDVDDSTLRESLLQGIDDDAAVFKPTPGKVQLFTNDAFVEGIHFDLTFTSMKHLGWKAMTATLSDIAAMGGTPRYAVATISLPRKISVEMVEELYQGIAFACKKYSCMLIGGDTTSTMGNMTITIALIGEAKEGSVIYRNGAKVGDLLCVSGHLGAAHAGLKILQMEKLRFEESLNKNTFQPHLEPYAVAIEKHLMPKPRLDIAKLLSEQVNVHALIDISDGLSSEVHRICKPSGVGAKVYEHKIPLDIVTQTIAKKFSDNPIDYTLYGGEEYELLFTMADEEFEKLESLTSDVTVIGRITKQEEGIELIQENGESKRLPFDGWDHFRTRTAQ